MALHKEGSDVLYNCGRVCGHYKGGDLVKRLVFLFLLLSSVANAAPVGNPFLRGVKDPAELARKIESSLATDPTGATVIDQKRCKEDGSCARPQDYLRMFKESDPSAMLRAVSDVPRFLKTLTHGPAPAGEYWMACLKSGQPVLHCLARTFKVGEEAWRDPQTGRIVLAQSCTNPVEKPVREQCAEVRFATKAGDTVVRFALLCPQGIRDECLGVKKAGEAEWQRWWKDECADGECNFARASMVVGAPVQAAGSYTPLPGAHVLRVPRAAADPSSGCRVVLCLDRDGAHSDGLGVRPSDYDRASSIPTATVWYDAQAVPSRVAAPLTWTWGEW